MTVPPLGCIPVILLVITSVCFGTLSLNGSLLNDRRRVERTIGCGSSIWSLSKVRANIAHRLPLNDTLGFLARHYSKESASSWQITQKAFLKMDRYTQELLGHFLPMSGRTFPRRLDRDLAALKRDMFAIVQEYYGAEVLANLRIYLKQRRQQNRWLVGT